MKFRGSNSATKPSINITPLVDVVFILLIFFAVSTTFMFIGKIEVDLPKASTTAGGVGSGEMIKVTVTRENIFFVDEQALSASELQQALTQAIEAAPGSSLMIEADLASMHGAVVTVIDAGKLAGFESFAIATEEQVK